MQKINWLEWTQKVFLKAKIENKPILLDIHGVWCHWCHVIEKTTYSDSEIIKYVNQNFVPIKVDTDKHPDINERYNMGGWPTTAILTPKGNIISGATYLTSFQMKEFLRNSLNSFNTLKNQIDEKNLKPQQVLQSQKLLNFGELIEETISLSKKHFDSEFGGFGFEPKFPMYDTLNFLILYYFETKDIQIKKILEKTLIEMYNGKMFDQQEFGFFRYSTTRDWSIPHFEKMLEDNSQLLRVYLNAFVLFGKTDFLNCVKDILDYLLGTLFDKKENYFFGTQDANEQYYSLDLKTRKKLKAPFIDKTLYTDWNCLMISNLFRASIVLKNNKFKETALKCLKTVEKKCIKGSEVFHFFDSGAQKSTSLLDYALLMKTYLDAYNYTLQQDFLDSAKKILNIIEKKFKAPDWGFYDIYNQSKTEVIIERKKPIRQNSIIAECLLKFNSIKNDEKLMKSAEKIIINLGEIAKFNGLNGAILSNVAYNFEKGITKLELNGKDNDQTKEFLKKALLFDFGNLMLDYSNAKTKKYPLLRICRKNVCLKTISDIKEFEKL